MLTGPRLEVFHPLPWHSLKQLSGIIIRILQTGNRLREVEQLAQITQLVDVELGFRLQVRLHSTTLGGPLLEALPPNERHFLFTFCKKHLLTLLHLLPPDCMCGQKAAPQPTLDFQREPSPNLSLPLSLPTTWVWQSQPQPAPTVPPAQLWRCTGCWESLCFCCHCFLKT